jgi:hypothetical protein
MDFGLIGVHTELMHESYERMMRVYIGISWQVWWGKYNGRMRLYSPVR